MHSFFSCAIEIFQRIAPPTSQTQSHFPNGYRHCVQYFHHTHLSVDKYKLMKVYDSRNFNTY